jgi:hypothetical protein
VVLGSLAKGVRQDLTTGTSGYFLGTMPSTEGPFRLGFDGGDEFYHVVTDVLERFTGQSLNLHTLLTVEAVGERNGNFGVLDAITLGIEDPWNPGLTTLEVLRMLTTTSGCGPGTNRRFANYPVRYYLGKPPANGIELINNIDQAFNVPGGRELVSDASRADVVFEYHTNDEGRCPELAGWFSVIGPTCVFFDQGFISLHSGAFESLTEAPEWSR